VLLCAAIIALPAANAIAQDGAIEPADTTAPPPADIHVHVFAAEGLTEAERDAIEAAIAAGAEAVGDSKVGRTPTEAASDADDELVTADATKALERSDKSSVEAYERVRNFDFEGALDLLDWAADEYSKNLVALMVRDGNATKLLNVYAQTAAVHYLNGDEEQAADALRQAFIIEPALQYSAEMFPPQLEDFVLEERFMFDEIGKATLKITATVGAPRVFVNGIERGAAPVEVHDVSPGTNFVTFVVAGTGQETVSVDIDGEGTVEVNTELAPPSSKSVGPLAGARGEIGKDRAGKKLGAAAKKLGADALLLVIAEPETATIGLTAYVYDMRTGRLSGRAETDVERDNPEPEAEELGREAVTTTRWELLIVISSPSLWDRTKGMAQSAYEWDYFWHTVGATAGVLVLTTIVVAVDGGLSPGKTVSILPVIDF
jgi:hypothetical protein